MPFNKGDYLKVLLIIILLSLAAYAAPVNVASLATSGNGTAANPFTGWETLTVQPQTEYKFDCPNPGPCWFAYNTSPNWLQVDVAVTGGAGVNLWHRGSGDAFVMYSPPGEWVNRVRVENITLWGNSQTRHGFYLRGVRDAIFSHLAVKNVTEAGLWSDACVTNALHNLLVNYDPRYTAPDGFSQRPKYGFVAADWSTVWTIDNLVVENLKDGVGVWLKTQSYGCVINGGTSEAHVGSTIGVQLDGGFHTFTNFDVEGNQSAEDWRINSSWNQIINATNSSHGFTRINGGGNLLQGGGFGKIIVGSGRNQLVNLDAQSVTDNGYDTIKIRVSGDKRTTIGVVMPRVFQPDASSGTATTNAAEGTMTHVIAVSNVTLATPLNPTNGQHMVWRIVTFGGPWTISYSTAFNPLGPLPLAVSAGVPLYVAGYYNATSQKWDIYQLK